MQYYICVYDGFCMLPTPVCLRKFAAATKDRSGRLMKELYAQYLESGEDWLASSLVVSQMQNETSTTGGRLGWMCKLESCHLKHINFP